MDVYNLLKTTKTTFLKCSNILEPSVTSGTMFATKEEVSAKKASLQN
jgi:ABC-type histidine transport system ATPase subunit